MEKIHIASCCFYAVVNCGVPPDPPSAGSTTFTTTTFLSEASYDCSNGYFLVGNDTRVCQEDATWSGTTPLCQSKSDWHVESYLHSIT